MQPGYNDNCTDETFLEEMVMNVNVIKRGMWKVMQDSVSISQYICTIALVVCIWVHTVDLSISELSLLKLDVGILALGFLMHFLTRILEISLLCSFCHNIFLAFRYSSGLYILVPIYHTLTRSISSDSISALTSSLLIIHLFLHDYSSSKEDPLALSRTLNLAGYISLHASTVASVLVDSRVTSRLNVFAMMLLLFAPFILSSIRKHRHSNKVHLGFLFVLMSMTLSIVYQLHGVFFVLLGLLVFISLVCPYWLTRVQQNKFEINGPRDELSFAKTWLSIILLARRNRLL